ncbi:nucleotidyltransferase family protein [Aquitalea sp. LB_tupeE]|uniref:nucleotidyltransferase family protein n=1 Tax=Aquitalea sp. LB_tupeE TaxID=2748078 RepID=UPI0015BA1615|nr:nucleotidyltransferase family protein [Aquitalea sp. LB_tupeE]NWK78488.1 nucleotidyltransferase family protein [Aquitalea sp. LB_tupeE]
MQSNALSLTAEQGVLLDRLDAILSAHPLLSPLLTYLEDVAPDCWLAAGAVRAAVWDHLHGYSPSLPAEIDIVYHATALDAADFEAELEHSLRGRFSQVSAWDIVNQATVHRWIAEATGKHWPPFISLLAALESWPETATAVAVRRSGCSLELIAPFGLDDLFAGVLRHNPARASVAVFHQRVTDKGWLHRWPDLIWHNGT